MTPPPLDEACFSPSINIRSLQPNHRPIQNFVRGRKEVENSLTLPEKDSQMIIMKHATVHDIGWRKWIRVYLPEWVLVEYICQENNRAQIRSGEQKSLTTIKVRAPASSLVPFVDGRTRVEISYGAQDRGQSVATRAPRCLSLMLPLLAPESFPTLELRRRGDRRMEHSCSC